MLIGFQRYIVNFSVHMRAIAIRHPSTLRDTCDQPYNASVAEKGRESAAERSMLFDIGSEYCHGACNTMY